MSGNSITIMLQALGVQNIQNAAQALQSLRAGIQGVQSMSGYGSGILPQMVTPIGGMGAGRTQYEEHNRQLTDQAKQIRDLTQTYKEYESQIFSLGRTYGYTTDQITQMLDVTKQLQGSLRTATGVNAQAYARMSGTDPVVMTQQLAGFAQQGVATTGGQQQQLIGAIEQAVMRGSQGGYTVLSSQLIPLLSNMNQAALNRNPYGYGMGGAQASLDFLGSAYQTGIPGLRGQGAANLYNQLDSTLTGASSGMSGALAWNAYQQAHPGSDFFQFDVGREAGMQDPAYAKAMIQQIRQVAGDDPTRRASLAKQWGIVSSAHQYMALEAVYSQSTNPQDYQQVLGNIGARKDIDPGAIGLIGGLEGTKDQAGVDAIIKQYEDLSGKSYGGKRDKASVEKMLGQIGPGGLMGSQADTISSAQANTSKNYEEAAQAMGKYITQMYQFNEALSKATETLVKLNPGAVAQVGAMSSIGGPILSGIGGLLSLGGNALMLGRMAGVLGGGAAASTAAAGTAAATTGAGTVIGGTGTSLLFGGGGAAGLGGGGGAAAAGGGLLAPGLVAGGGIAALAAGGLAIPALFQHMSGAQGAQGGLTGAFNRGGLTFNPLTAPFALPFMAARAALTGPLGGTGIGHAAQGANDWAADHIPGFGGLFGRFGGGSATGNATNTGAEHGGTYQSPLDGMIAAEKSQIDLLTKIEQHLAVNADFDRKAQAAYGASAPKTANAGGPVAPYVASGPYANATTTGQIQVGPSVPGTGTPGEGFGNPSVDQVEAMLKGTKLEGHGAEIVQFAKESGVPVSVAMGMIRQESGFNTPAGGTKNNFGGLKGKGGQGDFADFPDIKSGLQAVIGNMGSGIYQGISLSDYVNQYLGGASGGDPDAYIKNVIQMIQQFGGNAGPSSIPVQKGGGNQGGVPASVRSALAGAGSSAASGAAGMIAGGGGPMAMVGKLDLTVTMPDGSTQRHWVDMAPTSGMPYGGIQNWPTRGSDM